jgi:hypothetical protein
VTSRRPNVGPIRNPTLFEMDKLEQAGNLVNSLNVERPYSEPGLLLGTSAFTANGWAGAFYPPGMKPHDFLSYMRNNSRPLKLTAHITERRTHRQSPTGMKRRRQTSSLRRRFRRS